MQHYTTSGRRRRAVSKAPDGWPEDQAPPRVDDPPDLKPGAIVGGIKLEWYGRTYSVELRVPGTVNGSRRPRSDQVAAQIRGEWLVMSLRAALLEVDKLAPRVMTRKERRE